MRLSRTIPFCLAAAMATSDASVVAAPANAASCSQVKASSAEEGGRDKPGTKFSATATVDLTFSVMFPKALSGEHVLVLRVLTPGGHLFQNLVTPIADVGKVPREVRLRGFPHPVPQASPTETTENGKPEKRVEVPFAVAGTAILHSSLYGEWTVEAYVDGAAAPCASRRFTIDP